jgi:hypothetical protein
MAKLKTVKVPIALLYKDTNGKAKVRNGLLTLSLSQEDLAALQTDELGEIVIQGAVMPIDDHPQGARLAKAA